MSKRKPISPRKNGSGLMPMTTESYNPNQMKFLMNLLSNGGNITQAYRDAYDYSGNHGNVLGRKILSKPGMKELFGAMQERAFLAAGIDASQVLGETARVAFSNIKDLYDDKGMPIPVHKLPPGVAAAVKKLETEVMVSGDGETQVIKSTVEMRDKLKGLHMIGSAINVFKPDGSTEVNVNLVVDRMEAARKRAYEARKMLGEGKVSDAA